MLVHLSISRQRYASLLYPRRMLSLPWRQEFSIASLLHCKSNIECILCNPLCCISSRGSVVLPKVDNKAKSPAHCLADISSATLPSTTTGQAKPCNALHPMQQIVSAATVTNRVCSQVDGSARTVAGSLRRHSSSASPLQPRCRTRLALHPPSPHGTSWQALGSWQMKQPC